MQCYEAASVGTRNRWLAEHSCSQRFPHDAFGGSIPAIIAGIDPPNVANADSWEVTGHPRRPAAPAAPATHTTHPAASPSLRAPTALLAPPFSIPYFPFHPPLNLFPAPIVRCAEPDGRG